jgi:translocation and assembly module TamB
VTVRYPPVLSPRCPASFITTAGLKAKPSGDVLIKRALYEKRVEWKSMLLETFKGFSQRRKTEIGWIGETQLNIRFHGKDNILIQNNLAKIPIEVDTFIRGTPGQPQLLGRLEARTGVAYFRRNDFKIQHASVDFVDPNRINPILDIHAETRIREYLIRMTVSGAADRASVTFISDPPLSETDVLSMLALGKTSADLKGKGADVGMGEAASFATGQFQDIFERRARSLTGLDRFQVDPYLSKDTSVPRVTVGKELVQDKLYFTYSSNVGTTTPDTVFRIEYVLDKHFSLVGEQNELGTIGGDVKFRFEFK